jgi:hypothetical protein
MDNANTNDVKTDRLRIVLDCPPGAVRPDTLLAFVLIGTPLKVSDFIVTSKCFGSWTFELEENKNEQYVNSRNIIGNTITLLYHQSSIRYGEW